MEALLFTGCILSWLVGALLIVAGTPTVQILGGIAVLNGTVAFVGALILRALEEAPKP